MSTDAERLAAYRDAELKVLRGQEVAMEGHRLRRADADFIAKQIERLEARVESRAGRGRSPIGIPL
jgi:hypothetical protein